MIKVYVDAAVNGQQQAAVSACMIVEGQQVIQTKVLPIACDNHLAEFHALLYALEQLLLQQKQGEFIICYSDSKIVVQSFEKKYVKKEVYKGVLHEILETIQHFPLFFLNWIPEKQNKGADQAAKHALLKYKRKRGEQENEK